MGPGDRDPCHGLLERWARVIAIRKLRDALKRHRAKKRGDDRMAVGGPAGPNEPSMVALLDLLAGPGPRPSRVVARVEAVDAKHPALSRLTEDYRRAFSLVHIEGRSVAEAAVAVGRAGRAVDGLLRRGLKQLRESLGNDAQPFSSSKG